MCLAIPGQVVAIVDEPNRLAQVEVAGVRRTVNVGLLDAPDDGGGSSSSSTDGNHGTAARPGDWVLIHVGFAISRVDEQEAHATRALLERMGAAYEQELAELRGSAIQ